jgi:high-affinity iron transporter
VGSPVPLTRTAAKSRRHPAPWWATLAIALVAVLTAGGAASGASPTSGTGEVITVSSTACAPGWQPPGSGRSVFTVDNVSTVTTYEVDLVGANQVSVYGFIEMLAPGTEDTMDVVLPPGQYSFACAAFSGPSFQSQVEQVSGPPVSGAHAFVPVNAHQIQVATLAYRASLTMWMQRLASATDALESAVKSGRLAKARQLWLSAHLDYERLGATSGTFGSFSDEIDGTPFGLQGGVESPYFTGFLRLEYGLWSGQSASELIPIVAALDQTVHELLAQFPQLLLPANDLAQSTEQILENTLQFEMTGETDEGSNTNLATAWANVQATQIAIGAVAPFLTENAPDLLAQLRQGLSSMAGAFESYQRPNGTWEPLQSLSTSQRESLDGQLGGLLEELSGVPGLLEPIQPETSSS